MSNQIKIWRVQDGKIKEILIESDDEDWFVHIDDLDATLENINLLLDQKPALYAALKFNEGSEETQPSVEPLDQQRPIETEREDDFEAWATGKRRWESEETTQDTESITDDASRSFPVLEDESKVSEIASWSEWDTIDGEICPACGDEFKNSQGVLSHISGEYCESDEVVAHRMVNVRKQKLLLFVANYTVPVDDSKKVSLEELIDLTHQSFAKAPLNELVDDGLVDVSEQDSENPRYSINHVGLKKIKEVFESSPELLEDRAPALASYISNYDPPELDPITDQTSSNRSSDGYCLPGWDTRFDQMMSLDLIHSTSVQILPDPEGQIEDQDYWTGASLFAALLPSNLDMEFENGGDDPIIIEDGQVVHGLLNPDVEALFVGKVVDRIVYQHRRSRAVKFIRDLSSLIYRSMEHINFSPDIDPEEISVEEFETLKQILDRSMEEALDIVRAYEERELDPISDRTNQESFGMRVMQVWQNARAEVEEDIQTNIELASQE